ncbi:NirA family protein [Akkermansiaceae bacterium]|nr:NirA family protein [Akkermansiaceae bacterium]
MKIAHPFSMISNTAFTDEQKNYLAGRIKQCYPFLGQNAAGQFTNDPAESVEKVYAYPIDELCKEELIKHERNGLDVWDQMVKNADLGIFPQNGDLFRYKFYGMFHVTPAQESMMLRMRIPGGQLQSYQLKGIAEIAEDWCGNYMHITTRGNMQTREIMPENVVNILTKLADLGLTSKGAGADNVRNVTANPTSGFDRQEIIDVLPYAKAMHHYILNNRDLYGMPRKFNISFDSGGEISTAADSNDIGFYATTVEEGHGVEPGIYFRMELCGISGHKQLATDSGLLVKPSESVAICAAILRVFIENGYRDNRKKARLKYLMDDWGMQKFLDAVQEKLTFPLNYFPVENCEAKAKRPKDRQAHVGVHPQSQEGLSYVGVVNTVGLISPDQARKMAELSEKYGKGEVRLTIWQNTIIPHVPNDKVDALVKELNDFGLKTSVSAFSNGLISCTGSFGCKFAATATKEHSVEIAEFLESKFELDTPINVHFTGCNHSCAQHYCGDLGFMGAVCKVDGESVEGYHIVVGGGMDDISGVAKDLYQSVPYTEVPEKVENMISTYLKNRKDSETFVSFTRRHTTDELLELFNA